jgi:hypothetical protein
VIGAPLNDNIAGAQHGFVVIENQPDASIDENDNVDLS